MSKIINDKATPTLKMLDRFAKELGVSMAVFFSEPNDADKEIISSWVKQLPDDLKDFIRAKKTSPIAEARKTGTYFVLMIHITFLKKSILHNVPMNKVINIPITIFILSNKMLVHYLFEFIQFHIFFIIISPFKM